MKRPLSALAAGLRRLAGRFNAASAAVLAAFAGAADDLLFVLGALFISAGAWVVSPARGLVTAGVMCVVAGALVAASRRAKDDAPQPKQEGD